MPYADLNKQNVVVNDGLDSIVVMRDLADVVGGRTLDVEGFAGDVIKAGHIIIKTSAGVYKPMPVTGDAYASLPASHTYAGVLKASVAKSYPVAAILTIGQVNEKACPFPVTDAMKTALPRIEFTY